MNVIEVYQKKLKVIKYKMLIAVLAFSLVGIFIIALIVSLIFNIRVIFDNAEWLFYIIVFLTVIFFVLVSREKQLTQMFLKAFLKKQLVIKSFQAPLVAHETHYELFQNTAGNIPPKQVLIIESYTNRKYMIPMTFVKEIRGRQVILYDYIDVIKGEIVKIEEFIKFDDKYMYVIITEKQEKGLVPYECLPTVLDVN